MRDYLTGEEKIAERLSKIYASFGYVPYRMGKFEEYDLYSRNKDFLISDSVITFTDVDGKLMALKPDVTLSIIKNNRSLSGATRKLFYTENVYRVSKGTGRFKELMQSGVECIGSIDSFAIGECLLLSAKSLEAISADFVLDISSLDILLRFVERITDDAALRDEIIRCVSEKNIHSVFEICRDNEIDEEAARPLERLMRLSAPVKEAEAELGSLCREFGAEEEFDRLKDVLRVFSGSELASRVRLDFSVVSHLGYYNSVIFKGFVNGVPGAVLSGGCYDKLMKKMHRKSRAVGFAVYLDLLQRLSDEKSETDVDVLLVYADEPIESVIRAAKDLREKGLSVLCLKDDLTKLRFEKKAMLKDGEVSFDA